MKRHITNIITFSFICLFSIVGCDVFKNTADEYLQSGLELFEQGKYVQASLQFRNAIQKEENLIPAWYGLTLAEEKQGRMDKVYVLLNKVLKLDPTHVEARIKRGKIYLLGNLLDKALEDSNKLMELAAGSAAVRSFRAAVLLNFSDNRGAINEASLALKIDPNDIDALIVLATERLSKNDVIAAIAYLDKGISINEKNLVLQLIKVKALDSLGKYQQAVAVFQNLIILHPDDTKIRIALAKYYVANKKIKDAERVYREIAERNADDVDIKLDFIKFIYKQRGAAEAITQLIQFMKVSPGKPQFNFALAELYQITKKNLDAEEVYMAIINNSAVKSDVLLAKTKLATIAINQLKFGKARQLVNEILDMDITNNEGLLLLAIIDLNQGNVDSAIITLRTVLKNTPDSAKVNVLLARAHLKNNSIELAKSNYLSAAKKEPLNQRVILEYADFLVENNELTTSEDVLNSLLERKPDALQTLQALAQLKLRKGDWEGAHELSERIKSSGGQTVVVEQLLGAVYRGRNQYQQSIDAFKRAHNASPNSVQPIVALVHSYARLGKQKEASFFLKSVLKVNPSNIYALVLMGQRYKLDNKMDQAKLYFKRAIESNPNNALGYLELAKLHSLREQYSKAMDVIENGLAALPGNIPLKLSKARIQELMGRYEQAIILYEQILLINPNLDLAANNLASLLADHHSDNEKSLKRALEVSKGFVNSQNPYFRDTVGWVYYRLGEYAKATQLFKGATKTIPEMPIFHYHLGMSLLAEGKKSDAKDSLLKAKSLSGHNLTGMQNINNIINELL